MSGTARLRLLALVARHYLRRGFCYEQVRSIIWCRNDVLGCDAQSVGEVCRQSPIENNAEQDRQRRAGR